MVTEMVSLYILDMGYLVVTATASITLSATQIGEVTSITATRGTVTLLII
jgi:hypothetical protein